MMTINNEITNWHYPTEIFCGVNATQQLMQHCLDLNIQKPLFVTDKNLAQHDSIQNCLALLESISPTVFTDIKPNPTDDNIKAGIEIFNQAQCDSVVAIGGGSVLDVAKIIALIARQNLALWDLEDASDNYKRANIAKIMPCIAIPTTAGTGSEVGRAALVVEIGRAHV